ncbi:MAG: hypothetical protein AAGD96_31630 [Chloroflexota bacterium]
MYKKQLFITAFAYFTFLFFTACSVVDLSPSADVAPLTIVEAEQSDMVDSANEGSTEIAQTGAQQSGNMMSGNNMSSGSMDNNMSGQTMSSVSADEVPDIIDFPEDDIDSRQERQALEILVQDRNIALMLANYPDWHVEMWENEEWGAMEIDLFDSNWEWIAWGAVSLTENGTPEEVLDITAPQPLSAEAYQEGQLMAENIALNNPEVMAVLGDPAEWERWTWYDEWAGAWEIGFYRGIDEFIVRIADYENGEGPVVESIVNSALLDEDQQVQDNQNRAIEIAWQAEGIDEAIFGRNDDQEWFTYVTHLGGNEYGVSFATEEAELFFAHVDIGSESVISSQ